MCVCNYDSLLIWEHVILKSRYTLDPSGDRAATVFVLFSFGDLSFVLTFSHVISVYPSFVPPRLHCPSLNPAAPTLFSVLKLHAGGPIPV